jgi:undecaprenyl-diphosphatase
MLFWVPAALFCLVILLGNTVHIPIVRSFDLALSNALNLRSDTSPSWLIFLMQSISWIGGGIQRYILVFLLSLALWKYWGRGAGFAMVACALFSSFASDALKMVFGRIRPDLVPQLDPISSPAFTSGHSTNAAAVYLLFILLMPGKVPLLYKLSSVILILLTGLSRVMLGVHWPTDVLGGWMLGAAFALATYGIYLKMKDNKVGARNT